LRRCGQREISLTSPKSQTAPNAPKTQHHNHNDPTTPQNAKR
jgi:hypothetical protein